MDNVILLRAVYNDLEPFAKKLGGTLRGSATLSESLNILLAKPKGFVSIIEWLSDDDCAGDDFSGIVTTGIGIYVGQNVATALDTAAPLWLSSDGRALLENSNKIRDRVREITWIDETDTTQKNLIFRSAKQVILPDGTPLRCVRIEFAVDHTLPQPEYRFVELK